MNKKGWLVILLVLIVIGQFTVLSSLFHSFQTRDYAVDNSIVEITKMNYVTGWAEIQVIGASQVNPATLTFSNGTQVTLTSDYTFVMKLPKSGDCHCSASTGLPGTSVYINDSQPILAAVISNASSFAMSVLPESGVPYMNDIFVTYWFTIHGYATVSIRGYGVS